MRFLPAYRKPFIPLNRIHVMVDATLIVAVVGFVAVLGYVSNMIFERTRVPDAVWLILFGVIIAWLGPLPASGLVAFAPVLAAIAVSVM